MSVQEPSIPNGGNPFIAARRRAYDGGYRTVADYIEHLEAEVERLQGELDQLRDTVGPDFVKLAEIDALAAGNQEVTK